ncbi:4Fe-4S dicluster domain-containing protein [Consotaella salsifontis]|uniref:4Fe-4S dicluster domain-containing protein n=1 Tax=Consotaella salsifontis TaxID=1365950 RepID=A0A1T4MHJ0_9HYPH|nr:4Fe-4S binding protein [Consotaella salsifontis]SJZ66337.1 4Fe-4S dicluster domain-containing protein [Consotaella salsifontis]
MNFLALFARNLTKGPYTEPFPFAPAPTAKRFRGKIEFDAETCEGCRLCERVCPAGAIRMTRTAEGMTFDCWHDSCVFCGNCEFHCPTKSIHQTADWHLAHTQDQKFLMVEHALIPNQICAECGKEALATAPATRTVTPPLSPTETQHLKALCPKCRAKFIRARKAAA